MHMHAELIPSTARHLALPSHQSLLATFTQKDGRKVLKIILLTRLQQLFNELFQPKIEDCALNTSLARESYTMDSKIIQLVISGIVESGEYTLEGIANQTRIPFDIIYDAACGNTHHLSITPWAKIVDLYLQVNPAISGVLFERLFEIKDQNRAGISTLLNEI